ncbi:zn-finger, RanBP-type, containing protein isoform X3 [Zea mays]|uniref:zn-finger, RanBP-type, containing protein isoform X3 n=2 Tax=Zea mays TaxID=4577 RepID=UPI0004DEA0FD|nr:zn-finger, RanBP-type, containing protein isoform X3 [Zea mays]|eukprot:XP_023157266.1 zn-finger, RanBP-type, containing protein isoform X4 [Zea mays]
MGLQVDRRSQSAGKRARTDGSRREDDWVCPSCKNVNFAFRTTCNMRSCNQSRPADHTAMQTPPHYPTSGGYMGPGTPPSMYLGGGAPPYGSSMFNGPAVTRYGIPQFPGGSAYSYGYGGPIPMGSPYGPMQIAGPTPYSGGTMMTAGGMYGIPMDRYGPIPAGPGPMGTRAGSYSDEGSQKKPAGAGRDNDWECPNCHNINFGFRTVCNMRKCNTPRPANQGSKSDGLRGSKAKMPEGSWKCEQCNNINYPFRTKCNRPQCGAEKPSQTNNVNGSATDQDNQVCVSEPSVWSSTFAAPLFRTLTCMPIIYLILFLIILLPSYLIAYSLIYHVTVSPRTVMRVKKVQRRRQGSV